MTPFVRFKIRHAVYALSVSNVRGVRETRHTPLLQATSRSKQGSALGMVDWDGRLVPVFDPYGSSRRYVILVESGEASVALAVDDVMEVLRVAEEDIAQPTGRIDAKVTGVIRGDGELTHVVDPSMVVQECLRV